MRIAIVNETSAGHRNADILAALEGRGHEILNVGMTERGARPELSYSSEFGAGYPLQRAASQEEFRTKLMDVSEATHRTFPEIINALPDDFLLPAIEYPAMKSLLQIESIADPELRKAFTMRSQASAIR